ncbi:MAG TPA: DUF177 domain-containing protein [Thermohalobaculum sp.]|nr:DUF177 domain-containing protein [Thermohalobaculum sp.]
MTRPAATTSALPDQPFHRPMKTGGLRTDGDTAFRISAEPGEREALAPFLGVDAVERLTLAGFIGPYGKGGWRVRGRMVAKVVQTCVVTLEPLRTRIEEDIERTYVPANQTPRLPEVVLLHDDEDEPDPFTDSIDPAQLAVESLLLLIDPYPRHEGAALDALLGRDLVAEDGEETRKPFSGLADLMRRRSADQG